jgi:hypothetical protein
MMKSEDLAQFLDWKGPTLLPAMVFRSNSSVQFKEHASFTIDNILDPASLFPGKIPATFLRTLVRLALAIKSGEPVLLRGPSCYKSLLIDTWIKIVNPDTHVKVHLTSDTEASELVGQMQPYSFIDAVKLIPQVFTFLNCF